MTACAFQSYWKTLLFLFIYFFKRGRQKGKPKGTLLNSGMQRVPQFPEQEKTHRVSLVFGARSAPRGPDNGAELFSGNVGLHPPQSPFLSSGSPVTGEMSRRCFTRPETLRSPWVGSWSRSPIARHGCVLHFPASALQVFMTSLCFLHPPEWFQMQVLFSSEHPVRCATAAAGAGSPCSPSLRSRVGAASPSPSKRPLPSLCSRG